MTAKRGHEKPMRRAWQARAGAERRARAEVWTVEACPLRQAEPAMSATDPASQAWSPSPSLNRVLQFFQGGWRTGAGPC
jgi:hypothetical protein